MATSLVGPAQKFTGFTLQRSTGGSPPAWTTTVNISDYSIPMMSEKVDVTNSGDTWRRRIPTLLDMGSVTLKVFWVPTEPTHNNEPNGFRYLLLNQTLSTWRAYYPDGSYDIFPAYVTGFKITGSVGGVFSGDLELSNSGAPTAIA